jgi:hypothetical protein
MALLISENLKSYLKFFEAIELFLSAPLWQRGVRGDFIKNKENHLFIKSPLFPLFQSGIIRVSHINHWNRV